MRKSSFISCIAVCMALAFVAAAHADIKVASVSGTVAFKADRQWRPLTRGMTLREGTKVSTGVRSTAEISIDGATLTVRPLTMIKISRNAVSKDASDTKIALKYGGVNAKVPKLKTVKSVFKIQTPVATSSVRGTEQEVFFGGMSGMTIRVPEGTVDAENRNGSERSLRGKKNYRQRPDRSLPDNILSDVRDGALVRVHADDITDEEKQLHEYFDDYLDNGDRPDRFSTIMNKQKATLKIRIIWPY
ncbi:MAG TPA: FecR domain-containing protein [Spirochaetota bacterium]|nr:FecR domain-containing protein [Spirochaetota bacterium]HNT11749.1 FecR domain-containing protein [Spirochaetota bacterium]